MNKPKITMGQSDLDSIRQIFKPGDTVSTLSSSACIVLRKFSKKKIDHYDLCSAVGNKVVKNIPYYFLKLLNPAK